MNETTPTTKSWWASLVRLFHFGTHTTHETKTAMDPLVDHQTSTCGNENYLGSIKCRRSLHGDSFIG